MTTCGCTVVSSRYEDADDDERDRMLCPACGHLVGWHSGYSGKCRASVKPRKQEEPAPMTTDTKQPPDTDFIERIRKATRSTSAEYVTEIVFPRFAEQGLAIVDASRLAILDRYDEERKEWEAKVAKISERAHEHMCGVMAERDRAIAERDDLGCQLEALRSIHRGDVADLRTRMEALEKNESDVDERVCQLEAYRAVILETMKQMASSPDAYNEAERRARKVIYGDGNNVHRRSFAKELKSSVDPRDAKEARDRWQAVVDEKGGPDAGLEGLAFPPKGGA